MHSAPSMEATEREAVVNKEERHHLGKTALSSPVSSEQRAADWGPQKHLCEPRSAHVAPTQAQDGGGHGQGRAVG